MSEKQIPNDPIEPRDDVLQRLRGALDDWWDQYPNAHVCLAQSAWAELMIRLEGDDK
jgi:hypothetical protein